MIAALFVETNGCYFNLPFVDPWDIERDARKYCGPYPVVAHPPCQRWGKYWHGSPVKPHQYKLGDDQGCFASALTHVRNYGGIIEHPAYSKAWEYFGIKKPKIREGWTKADNFGGFTCQLEQGHYGHFSKKPTWLYAVNTVLPELNWSTGVQRINEKWLEKHGYKKAVRCGMIGAIGGKNKTIIRNATPIDFRNLLISIALTAKG